MKTLSVIGLGKLGLCLAAILAKHCRVIGIDVNEKLINDLKYGDNPIKETDLNNWLKKYKQNITFTTSFEKLGEINFIVVPTPSDVNGRFNNEYVKNALCKSGKYVLVSTVMPGTVQELNRAQGIEVIYNPTFIALGSVIHDFLNPNFILIGNPGYAWEKQLKSIYKKVCLNNPKVFSLSPIEAEIAKLSLNCYITTKITFANQIGNLCHRLGIKPDNILNAIGQDRRIGTAYFKAGLGYGGTCFPRDNVALSKVFEDNELRADLLKTVDRLNLSQIFEIIGRITKNNPATIGFKSLSYKKGTDNTECSQLKMIHDSLKQQGYKTIIGKGDINLDWGGIIE